MTSRYAMIYSFKSFTQFSGAFLLGLTTMISDVASKPLLTNSQSTYASACIEQSDTPERLIEICQLGLEEAGSSDAQRIEMLDRMAWAYVDVDDLDRAHDVFDQILTIDPNAEPGLQGQGWVLYLLDDYPAAVELFRQAVLRKPNAQNMAGLASSQHWAGQIEIDEFENYMRASLALDPEYPWGMRELAWVLAYDGQYDKSHELFTSALEINDADANAEYGLAYIRSERQQWDDALDHVNRALELDEEFISARSRRSLILLMLDRPKQALKDADAVIEARPDDSDGYVRRARALSALGRRSEAHKVLDEAKSRAGESGYLVYWQASLLADDAEFNAALALIRRGVEMDGADHFDHRLHAEIALELDKIPEARDAIDRSLALGPSDSFGQFINAMILIEEENFVQAEEIFDGAIDAGLSEEYLEDFMSALISHGRFMQAIKMRVRYS